MQTRALALEGVLLMQPTVHLNERGFFIERFNQQRFNKATGLDIHFVQDNHSRSSQHVLRGMHYQNPNSQGKLVQVLAGKIFDVVIDIRPSSTTFGQWIGTYLDATQYQQLWIPSGFAHGFLVLSEYADVLYKTTDYYAPDNTHTIKWDDADLAIDWPLQQRPILSANDRLGESWQQTRIKLR